MKVEVITTMAALLLTAVLASCSSGVEPGTIQPERQTLSNVTYEVVKTQNVPQVYETSGTVVARTSAMVASKIMGTIKQVLVTEGEPVRKGQLLLTIDDRDIQAKIQQAKAGADEARNALQEVSDGIRAAGKALEAAKAQRNLMDATYKRYQNLKAKDSVSQQEFDEIQAKWQAATAQYDQAQAMLDSLKAKKGQVNNKIQQAQAAVNEASSYLAYTNVTAPFDGRVLQKFVDSGSLAAPGMPLVSVEKRGGYQLLTSVDESLTSWLKIGAPVAVSIPAIGLTKIECPIQEIVPAVDPGSRSMQVKLGLPDNTMMHSGLFGKVYFTHGEAQAILIPEAAVFSRGALDGVFVIGSDNILHWRIVKTGKTDQGQVEITAGLEPGEKVVTANVDRMIDGAKVEVKG